MDDSYTLKIIKHCWEKLKRTWINREILCSWVTKLSILNELCLFNWMKVFKFCVCVLSHLVVSSSLQRHMDCRPQGSSVCGIFQARRLEWVAVIYFRESKITKRSHQSCIRITRTKSLTTVNFNDNTERLGFSPLAHEFLKRWGNC